MDRPNVLWICTDQHHYRALSCANHAVVDTPNIDRIAEEGVQFTDAYCPAPVCGPSRASMFSGQYRRNNGVEGNWEPFDEGVSLLPEMMTDVGYHTALVGKLHFVTTHSTHGFQYARRHDTMNDLYYPEKPYFSDYVEWLAEKSYDGDVSEVVRRANADEGAYRDHRDMLRFILGSNWRSEEEHSNTWITDETCEYLQDHREDPFFLFTSYFGPHQPMKTPGRWADRYDPDEIPLPPEFDVSIDDKPLARRRKSGGGVFSHFDLYGWDETRVREVLAAYYGQVEMIDHGIGRILDELEEQGIRDETIVAFTADHGDHAGQFGWFFKSTLYEGSAHVPLLVDDPEGVSGETCDCVVNNMDLFATVLDRCGVDYDVPTPARSLAPLCRDPNDPDVDIPDRTFVDQGNGEMVVEGDFKILRGEDPHGNTAYEMYDRSSRPDDAENLWDHPDYVEERAELIETLETVETALDENPAKALR